MEKCTKLEFCQLCISNNYAFYFHSFLLLIYFSRSVRRHKLWILWLECTAWRVAGCRGRPTAARAALARPPRARREMFQRLLYPYAPFVSDMPLSVNRKLYNFHRIWSWRLYF